MGRILVYQKNRQIMPDSAGQSRWLDFAADLEQAARRLERQGSLPDDFDSFRKWGKEWSFCGIPCQGNAGISSDADGVCGG